MKHQARCHNVWLWLISGDEARNRDLLLWPDPDRQLRSRENPGAAAGSRASQNFVRIGRDARTAGDAGTPIQEPGLPLLCVGIRQRVIGRDRADRLWLGSRLLTRAFSQRRTLVYLKTFRVSVQLPVSKGLFCCTLSIRDT